MIPVRVVEIVPVLRVVIDPVEVVEIIPVLVVEIVPVLVVEIVPVFANVVADRAATNNAAQTTDLRFFIAMLLVIPKVRDTRVGLWSFHYVIFRPTRNK